jgi:hypothetical protein
MSGLIPIVARAAGSGAIKKIATRVVAGITGAGAKTVAPVYRNIETGSVKVIPQSSISNFRAKNVTEYNTNIVNRRKSGEQAKSIKDSIEPIYNTYKKSPTIKINSNPKRGN